MAKIERAEAVEALDEIIHEADAIMVARGDLGVEIDIARIAGVQKQIIRRCRQARVPVITATHMLESMRSSRLPTRAEATDVANAILDGSDALMLSAETAIGHYPVEAVAMMGSIARETEPLLEPWVGREPGVRSRQAALSIIDGLVEATSRLAEENNLTIKFVAADVGDDQERALDRSYLGRVAMRVLHGCLAPRSAPHTLLHGLCPAHSGSHASAPPRSVRCSRSGA